MNEKLCGTPITGDYLAKHLKEALGPHAILRSVEGKKIAEGQGYGSNLLRLKLIWEVEDNLPQSVIVKAPTAESMQKLMETMAGTAEENEKMKEAMAKAMLAVHDNECKFYDLVGKMPPVEMPNCYVALPVMDTAPGMIVLEDLR